jgi:RimJ/RimL family protein N-acetyltransferase
VYMFTFKLIISGNFLLLFHWFSQDYIAQLWVEPKEWKEFQNVWQAKLAVQDTFRYIAYVQDKPVGYIQYFKVNDTDRAHFPGIDLPDHSIGLDLFIGEPEYLGKGYGTQLMRDFIELVKIKEPQCTTIIIDPALDNLRAIKCYEKIGFKKIGIFNTPYGPRGDGAGEILLMMYKL